ncbi:MAG: hypothetical protein J6A28_01705 [Clostridia bacterium]|nr:hypothetical protein [Clostridia bacterium]
MKTLYEVKHYGKVKKFDDKEKALTFASSLEKLGYPVRVYVASVSLLAEVRALIYQTNNKG